ncbi:sporulation membrane protein YtaF [Metabacillus iocasae]|uniref:Sporulation protein YtaF n=1 Tax=Priestia iocasae TaxID=2291674 RepID=A0ABS2QP67_9BACI|nr:sporulation membrane protein YtaF [Metabacillus iocasae]MBM7701245.1 putative sporulation protein YtaF [Metabacillus iocasae]
MTVTLSLLVLAFAVSLDSFSVGLTYGLRKMVIPLKSIVIIAGCSAISLMTSMFLGKIIAAFFSPQIMEKMGGYILVLLGGWILYQFFRSSDSLKNSNEEKVLFKLEIQSFGVVINILKKPTVADFDQSGSITGIEAFVLGVALSLDAFGAGIGAALLGYSPFYLAIAVALMSSIFLYAGIRFGKVFSALKWMKAFSFLPGILLIVLGIWKL